MERFATVSRSDNRVQGRETIDFSWQLYYNTIVDICKMYVVYIDNIISIWMGRAIYVREL